MWPRMRLKMISCTSTTSGNSAPMALSLDSSRGLERCPRWFRWWRLALNVGKDGGDLGDVGADVSFEKGDAVVSGEQEHGLIEFDVQFDVNLTIEILHADVVHHEVIAQRGSADAAKVLSERSSRGTALTSTSESPREVVNALATSVATTSDA